MKSVYPHTYIYANKFMDLKTAHIDNVLILTIENTRTWGNEEYWVSDLPNIYFSIIDEIIEEYRKNGLGLSNYLKSLHNNALTVGELSIKIAFRRLLKQDIKFNEKFLIKKMFIKYSMFPNYYLGLLRGIIKLVISYDK